MRVRVRAGDQPPAGLGQAEEKVIAGDDEDAHARFLEGVVTLRDVLDSYGVNNTETE